MSRGGNFARERRERIEQASQAERAACAKVYAEHREACAENGVEPAAWDVFFFEWLKVSSRFDDRPRSGELYEGYRRSYERMFEGLCDWD